MIVYLWLGLAWFLYFFIHSLMAAEGVRNFFKVTLQTNNRYYRLLYSAISVLGLALVLYYYASLKPERILETTKTVKYISLFITTAGVLVIRAAFKEYSLAEFLGFKIEREDVLRESGILKFVRHPIYSGTILITIGFFLFTPTIATAVSCGCIFIYLLIGIKLEESKLTAKFGEKYKDYCTRVPAIFPRVVKAM